jgi:DNA gyrase/topoisomerase IV subunit A
MELEIVLTKIGSEESDFYIDVSGCEINHDQNSSSDTYSLTSTKWNEWLGMNINQNTLNEFNELEIISHCLYEMTFFAFDEEEIQNHLASLEESIEEYKELSDEEKKSQTLTHDELLKKIEENQDEN